MLQTADVQASAAGLRPGSSLFQYQGCEPAEVGSQVLPRPPTAEQAPANRQCQDQDGVQALHGDRHP
jgi:hypothetical protein